MRQILCSWIGDNDLKSLRTNEPHHGPIYGLLSSGYIDDVRHVCLLGTRQKRTEKEAFTDFLQGRFDKEFSLFIHDFEDPTDFHSIYKAVRATTSEIQTKEQTNVTWSFYISPGTSHMAAVWLLLGKTIYNAKILQAYFDRDTGEQRVSEVDIPFSIDAEYIPRQIIEKQDLALLEKWTIIPEFVEIKQDSSVMKRILSKAYQVAVHDVPVFIYGETGTGKELLAQAIYKASTRSQKPMEVFNCSAVNKDLIHARLFGWSKGAWTGAQGEDEGLFVKNDSGTVFLDELGELDLATQSSLLRVLETGEVQRVGDGKTKKVDVRIIAATNRNIPDMVNKGAFREDLWHRLCVAYLELPPLRERGNDIKLLAQVFIDDINNKFSRGDDRYVIKKLSSSAIRALQSHDWPGNVRELFHVLQRACLWETESILEGRHIEEYLVLGSRTQRVEFSIPGNLEEYLNRIRRKYCTEAYERCHGNKSQAAEMLGYNNSQTFTNHLNKEA